MPSVLSKSDQSALISIQSLYRGNIYRRNNLPNSIINLKNILEKNNIKCSTIDDDGRINSTLDEKIIINILKNDETLKNRIKSTDKRYWYDIKILDYMYGWLVINIKSTTLNTADNIGNMTLIVQSWTSYSLDYNKTYNNGNMSKIFITQLSEKKYNYNNKKDYYFLVINKNDTKDIIINSIKGLTNITKNKQNLPFQVKWKNNREYKYRPIKEIIKNYIELYKNEEKSWQTTLLEDIKNIHI